MKNKTTSIGIVFLLVLSGFIGCIIIVTPTVKASTTVYVDDDNMGFEDGSLANPFNTIQEGINAANNGDTVFVFDGTYFENVIVNKTINLTGISQENTIIDGGGMGTVVYFLANGINLTGFTITNAPVGIRISSFSNQTISNNTITGIPGPFAPSTVRGIAVENSLNNNIIGNKFYNNDGFAFETDVSCLYLKSSSHNYIAYNNISDNGGTSPWYGIYLYLSEENNITNNRISFNQQDGIYLTLSSNNSFHNNIISGNNRMGIQIQKSSTIQMIKNNFTYNGIFLSGDELSHFNSHEIPKNNLVNSNPIYYIKDLQNLNFNGISAGQIILANCSFADIENLQLGETDVGIEIAYTKNVNIRDIQFENNYYGFFSYMSSYCNLSAISARNNRAGINFRTSSNNTLKNSNISLNTGSGISLYKSSNSSIINTTSSNNNRGIILSDSTNNQVKNNIILYNDIGIFNSNSPLTSIHNNIIKFSGTDGIFAQWSPNCTVFYNNFSFNNGRNIYFHYSANVNISGNYISNTNYGIWLNALSDNVVSYNTVYNNNIGIQIASSISPNNLVYHNNILENTQQATDDNNNLWDNGYPSGGNYWSDYAGIDIKRGPLQDIPGSDGIGDTPYTSIGGGSGAIDNYPLLGPVKKIFLEPGWNLISIPYIQSDTNLKVVLSSIEGSYDAVQWYNTTYSKDHWKHYQILKPSHLNDLQDIDHKMGIWIHITDPFGILFQIPGIPIRENQTISLKSGWNLIGYPSLSNKDRATALNNIFFGSDVDSIWTYYAKSNKWKEITGSDYFEIGHGYWIHCKHDVVWEVPI
jgi:parallel beta-helix repeat protein